ncbi:MAG: aldo/keto reductase [Eubacterium sp.]|nr:aldo/keto reductase [Candidatus Colimonas fimequi]
MQYRKDKYGNDISILGYGCMRFGRKGASIDIDKATSEIKAAYDAGVNYYDTAYIYPGSEAAIGEIFSRLDIRDKIHIATKLPHYLVKKAGTIDKMFNEELKRLKTDYIDFYLMHMINDVKSWERMKGFGVDKWIEERKAEGSIRQIGFSYHGDAENFCELIDAYDWDFAMIQYNYMDENTQAGRKGLEYAASKGIPIVIMEPLRGGKLVNNLPKEAKDLFDNHPAGLSPAQWAFKWLWNQPQVMCVLSGMNSMEMVEENVTTANDSVVGMFGEEENQFLRDVSTAINAKLKVGCTGCGYCMPCPKGVDIPACFHAYNMKYAEGFISGMRHYMQSTTFRKTPTIASNCIGCGACEKHCPQAIPIRDELKNVQKSLEGPIYTIASKVVKTVMKY